VDKAPIDSLVGRTVANYDIVARLGGGGMGLVYAARDTRLGRPVALKFLPPQWSHDESARERFIREAQAASATDHPNICTIHDIGTTDDGQLFIVMAQYDGETLKKRLERGPLGVDEAIDVAAQVAEGLAKAHAQGVVHRDVKPGNLMLTADGVKILDFGLAKFADARFKLTLEGSTVGTIAYMSPEQTRGEEADARSDVWALGAVLYEMLAGDPPFKGGYPEAIAHAIKHEPPTPVRAARPEVPESLEQLVFRALHKDPAVRFQSARDVARALRQLQGRTLPLDLRTQPVSVPTATSRPPSRRMWTRPALAAGVAAAGITGVWLLGPAIGSLVPGARSDLPIPDNKAVAVLPFEVVGGTPQDQAWATGISVVLSTMLTQVTTAELQIAPLGQLQADPTDGASLRQELGATLIVTGSVERAEPEMHVAARLLDATTSQELRASSFSVAASDPAALFNRLLEAALQMLEIDIAASEYDALRRPSMPVAAASELYLQGRGHLQFFDRPENIERAIAAFTDALQIDSKYAQAHGGLGEAYWRKYEGSKETSWSESALASCTQALVLDPRLAAAHLCLGRVHSGRGRYEEAAVEFQRALEIEPTSDEAYASLGFAQQRLGRLEEAEATYRRAIALRPRHWENYNALGRFYYEQGRYGDAAQMFAQVVALIPDSFRGYSNLGGAHIRLGRYDEAITALERAVSIRPTAVNTSNLGTAYFNRGRFGDAARALEQAVKLGDTNYEVWGNLGDAYYWAPGSRALAADAYRRAVGLGLPQLKVNPRNAGLIIKLAHYYAMLRERNEALELADRALQISPKDSSVQFWAAVALNRLGETERALDLLEKARAGGFSITVIRDTPDLGNLWGSPRFQNLLRGQ